MAAAARAEGREAVGRAEVAAVEAAAEGAEALAVRTAMPAETKAGPAARAALAVVPAAGATAWVRAGVQREMVEAGMAAWAATPVDRSRGSSAR